MKKKKKKKLQAQQTSFHVSQPGSPPSLSPR